MTSKPKIDLEQARRIAEAQASLNLAGYVTEGEGVLQPEYLEGDHCWMFFRDKKNKIPANALLGIEWAYVVSKYGKFSLVEDFSDDGEKLLEYLEVMSAYFARRGE
jgi:hypothetical protein